MQQLIKQKSDNLIQGRGCTFKFELLVVLFDFPIKFVLSRKCLFILHLTPVSTSYLTYQFLNPSINSFSFTLHFTSRFNLLFILLHDVKNNWYFEIDMHTI